MQIYPAITSNKGFTLIEIMVVLVVITATISMAALNMGGNSKAEKESEIISMGMVLDSWRDQAYIKQRSLGIQIYDNKFHLLSWQQEMSEQDDELVIVWSDDKTLDIPEWASVEIELSEDLQFNESDFDQVDEDSDITPLFILLPDGQWESAITMIVDDNDEGFRWALKTDGLNPFYLAKVNQ